MGDVWMEFWSVVRFVYDVLMILVDRNMNMMNRLVLKMIAGSYNNHLMPHAASNRALHKR